MPVKPVHGKGVAVVLIDNDFKDCGRLSAVAPNDSIPDSWQQNL